MECCRLLLPRHPSDLNRARGNYGHLAGHMLIHAPAASVPRRKCLALGKGNKGLGSTEEMVPERRVRGFFFRKTFPAGAEKAKTCQPRSCTRLGYSFCTHRHLAPGSRGRKGLLASSALGRNARPARFRPGLVEERQGWDESFFFFSFLLNEYYVNTRRRGRWLLVHACVKLECIFY